MQRATVVYGALSAKDGMEQLVSKSSSTGSFLVPGRGMEYDESLVHEVPVHKIDTLVGKEPVNMIKMDVEGAEYAALNGAAETIKREKPLLAICVYHKPGDVLAIMDYCKTLVPEYRIWLRQHSVLTSETVLYAAV